MILTLTLKLTAETKGELIDTFAAHAQEFKTRFEDVITKDGFTTDFPPEKVVLRWIFETGKWATAAA